MGADTTVPLARTDYPASDPAAGSLYLVDHSGTWHLLRPQLVAQHCRQYLSTFHAGGGVERRQLPDRADAFDLADIEGVQGDQVTRAGSESVVLTTDGHFCGNLP
jgi:hypothetical protein